MATSVTKVMSSDGTLIALERSGSGPVLVLVHGTASDRNRWNHLLPQLAPHFTVAARSIEEGRA